MKAELQIAALTVEHNLSFNLSDHRTQMMKNAYPDSAIGKCVTCGRKKTAAIIRNVLGKQQFEDLCEILKSNKFSICVDESSTDMSTTKVLSIVVRTSINFKANDFFFSLVKVTAADAETIYQTIMKVFNDAGINVTENLISFAADGANAMTGRNNSVASRFKAICPHIIIMKCICHSFALCASYACLKLPNFVESTVRDIYNYVQNSPKRIAQLEEIIGLLEDKPRKLLHPCQTRWLSLEKVVNRILTLYEPLKIYFAMAVNLDQIENASIILNNLN